MKDIILLHGALGAAEMFEPLEDQLSSSFNVHTLNFSGHGKTKFEEDFGIEQFAQELETYISQNNLNQPIVFGYSMGGYVALYLESQLPGTFDRIITYGTKFGWTQESAGQEVSRLNPEVMEEKIPTYTHELAKRHGEQWKKLVWQTAGMMIELGEEPLFYPETLSKIQCPVQICRGTKDHMVTEAESTAIADQLKNGTYKSLENWEHPLEKLESHGLKSLIEAN